MCTPLHALHMHGCYHTCTQMHVCLPTSFFYMNATTWRNRQAAANRQREIYHVMLVAVSEWLQHVPRDIYIDQWASSVCLRCKSEANELHRLVADDRQCGSESGWRCQTLFKWLCKVVERVIVMVYSSPVLRNLQLSPRSCPLKFRNANSFYWNRNICGLSLKSLISGRTTLYKFVNYSFMESIVLKAIITTYACLVLPVCLKWLDLSIILQSRIFQFVSF